MTTMKVSAPNEGSSVEHVKGRVSPDTRLGTIHAGTRYVLGFGPDSYGIWDEYSKGAAVEHFPATDQGRGAAWRRYVELEPGAGDAHEAALAAARPQLEQTGGGRRWPVLVAILVVVAGGIIALVVARSGGNGGNGGTTAVDVGKEAHIDVSGGLTLTEDLTLETFEASGIQAVFGGVVDATWKGLTSELHIELHSPTTGTGTTTQITFRAIELTLTPVPGTTIEVSSSHGECSYNVENLSDTGFSGTFACAAITAPNLSAPIDVNGTFAAEK
ncbi:MAG TPA: hypothetical protein VF986_09020 [Actinomycetota bacterium]